MKKFIISLFFVIFALFNVCGEDVKGEIILPKIERKFVDNSAQNPLKATNVEGIFIVNPYKGDERRINNKGYRIFVLDKNSNELLYVIEDVVIDWHPNHNRGWGGRVVEDDFCLLTKDCVEYIIKGNKFNCEVHSYLEGKYLTEDGEDLLHPVIRDDIDEDIKKIEQALVDYVLYPDLVERGFDVHRLDNMKIDGEMFEYIESFFRPHEEKGWLPLDNHHNLSIRDENGKWFSSQGYKRAVIFTNEYGTKDELLKKGYIENETMFYYPSNGEKDWRVGEWSWSGINYRGEFFYRGPKRFEGTYASGMGLFDGGNYIYGDGKNNRWFGILETKKSVVIDFDVVEDYINDVNLPKKDNLIIDLSVCNGGRGNAAWTFAKKIKNSKYKKIYIIMNDDVSASEDIIERLDTDKRVIKIGLNTNGALRTSSLKGHHLSIEKKFYFNSGEIDVAKNNNDLRNIEGIGFLPDIWADNKEDIFKNVVSITGDTELKIGTHFFIR